MDDDYLCGDDLRRWLPPDPEWKKPLTWREWVMFYILVIVAAVIVLLCLAFAIRQARAVVPPISLFATICIDGAMHGLPKTLCREFQIEHYPSIESCNLARKDRVGEWLAGLAWLSPHLVAERCGPAEPEGEDDI